VNKASLWIKANLEAEVEGQLNGLLTKSAKSIGESGASDAVSRTLSIPVQLQVS
jgi:hypothetical protein